MSPRETAIAATWRPCTTPARKKLHQRGAGRRTRCGTAGATAVTDYEELTLPLCLACDSDRRKEPTDG